MTHERDQLGTWPLGKTSRQAQHLLDHLRSGWSPVSPPQHPGQDGVNSLLWAVSLFYNFMVSLYTIHVSYIIPTTTPKTVTTEMCPDIARGPQAGRNAPRAVAGTVTLPCRLFTLSWWLLWGLLYCISWRMSYILIILVPYLCFCSSLCISPKNLEHFHTLCCYLLILLKAIIFCTCIEPF